MFLLKKNKICGNIVIIGLITKIIHRGYQMIKKNKNLLYEIRKVREQLNECIEKNGISEEPSLIDINDRLDEMILEWMKSNK